MRGKPFMHGPHWPATRRPGTDPGRLDQAAPAGRQGGQHAGARRGASGAAPRCPGTPQPRPAGQPAAVVAADEHRLQPARRCRRRRGAEHRPRACRWQPRGCGPGAARSTVTSSVPGSARVPTARNQGGPYRAISARCASVSTFCTRVGAPPWSRSVARGGMNAAAPGRRRGGDHGRLLAGQESRRGEHDRHGEPVPAAAGPSAIARRIRAGSLAGTGAPGCADGPGGHLQPVQHQVGRGEQHRVLVAGRLAFRAVGHDHRPGAAARGDRGELRCAGNAAPPRPVRPDARPRRSAARALPAGRSGPCRARWAGRAAGAAGSSRGRSCSARPAWCGLPAFIRLAHRARSPGTGLAGEDCGDPLRVAAQPRPHVPPGVLACRQPAAARVRAAAPA